MLKDPDSYLPSAFQDDKTWVQENGASGTGGKRKRSDGLTKECAQDLADGIAALERFIGGLKAELGEQYLDMLTPVTSVDVLE